MVHNKQFAAAYGGMHVFRPMEIFYQAIHIYIYIYNIFYEADPCIHWRRDAGAALQGGYAYVQEK